MHNGGSLSETSKKKKRKAAEQATLRIENGTQSEKDVTGTSEGMFMGGAFPDVLEQVQENGHREEEEKARQTATIMGKRRGRHLNSGKKIASISGGSHLVICKFL